MQDSQAGLRCVLGMIRAVNGEIETIRILIVVLWNGCRLHELSIRVVQMRNVRHGTGVGDELAWPEGCG